MLSFDGVLTIVNDYVVYKKTTIKAIVSSMRTIHQKRQEPGRHHILPEEKHGINLPTKAMSKKERLSIIVFESGQDFDSQIVYACYDDFWLLDPY